MSAISTKPNVPKKHSKLQETWRRFSKNGRAVVGLCIVIILVLCAVLAPIISPYEPNAQDPRNRLQGPSAGHWFGTDELGRDILSRIIYGARISMSVGLIAICISLIGGVTLGAIAGYYGGTIDSNGMHWAEVIWMAYEALKVPVSKAVFRDAYVHGERTLGKNPIVKPHHTFLDMLRLKSDLQIQWLKENGHLSAEAVTPELPEQLADWCYEYARKAIDSARPILEQLAERYPLVLVSNFYGNIESVLKDFGLDHLFSAIVESAVVGIRKPDPAIFRLGVDKLGFPADEIVVVGDSYDKDIVPATRIGCQTIWLKSIGWSAYKGNETADIVLSDFTEIKQVFAL